MSVTAEKDGLKYYQALGLDPALTLDAADLQTRFYQASRRWHPDRYMRAGAAEQAHALEMTAVLNDAFRTLRDPVTRAEYFLQEHGITLTKGAPPELLEEVFELNMALEELRSGDASARPQLEQAQARFMAMLAECDETLAAQFTQYDQGGEGRGESLDAIRDTLNRRRYIANLVSEVEKELNVDVAN